MDDTKSTEFTPDKSLMINKTNNIYRTKALFYEVSYADTTYAQYSLSVFDNPPYVSLYRLYLEMEDTEEFEFANRYFLGMEHWRKLCECTWFKPLLKTMREDLQKKLKSRALRNLKESAQDPKSRSFFQANKYLADKGYLEENPKKSKGETQNKKDSVKQQITEDWERMAGSIAMLPQQKGVA